MTRDDAIGAADRAAAAVFGYVKGPKAFKWYEYVESGPAGLAGYLDQPGPAPPAEALYIEAVTAKGNAPKPWREVGRPLRAALETFRGTYLVLMMLAREDAGSRGRAAPSGSGALYDRDEDRAPDTDEREHLR